MNGLNNRYLGLSKLRRRIDLVALPADLERAEYLYK